MRRIMTIVEIEKLPKFEDGNLESVKFSSNDGSAELSINLIEEQIKEIKIFFNKVRAIKHLSELYCDENHLQAYMKLCLVNDSDWSRSLDKISNDTNNSWTHKHFMIYIIDYGVYEVIAESHQLDTK
jgi:hypothetical protein